MVLAIMTMYGRSVDPEISRWKSWVLSYYAIAYPEIAEVAVSRNPREYYSTVLPDAVVTKWVTSFNSVNDHPDYDYTERIDTFDSFPELVNPILNADVVSSNDLTGLYSYAALLMFLAGKLITAQNRSAIVAKRPKALMDEFQVSRSEYILSGDGRIGDAAHVLIHSAWTASVDPRIAIVNHFATAMGAASTPYRVMSHMMKLMRMNGMNYVNLILRFLEAFEDDLINLPQLRSDIRAFKDSASRYETIDPILRPFYKFAYGNECTIFRRRDMDALVACAIVYAANTADTVSNYRIGSGYSNVLKRVEQIASAKGILFTVKEDQATVIHAL